MIIKIIKENDYYRVFYMNGSDKGIKKYWSEMSVSEKLEINEFLKYDKIKQ